jgi:hypothetical protein
MVDTLLTEAYLQMDLRAIQTGQPLRGIRVLSRDAGTWEGRFRGVQMLLNAESRL